MPRTRQIRDKAEVTKIILTKTVSGYVPEVWFVERSTNESGDEVGQKPEQREVVAEGTDLLTQAVYNRIRNDAVALERAFLRERYND